MKIQIDDREYELIHYFKELNLDFEIKRLEIGDLIMGNAVIERKGNGDFISSLLDGRLIEQINNMQQNYEKCCIVLMGNIYNSQSKIKDFSILGMLASISARTNINIISLNCWRDTAYFCHQFLMKANDGKEFKKMQIKKSKLSFDMKVLLLIAKIGEEQAIRLLGQFGNCKEVLKASTEQLMEIEGIGLKTAMKIREFGRILYG